jgi:hypothetical protein
MPIVYRSVKGSALTSDEVDGNFEELEDSIADVEADLASYLLLAGGSMTGDINFATTKGIKKGLSSLFFNGDNVDIVSVGVVNVNATGTSITNVGNTAANLNLYGLLINITGNQKFLTSGTGLYNSTSVASILFGASEAITVNTTGNIVIGTSSVRTVIISPTHIGEDSTPSQGESLKISKSFTDTSGTKYAHQVQAFTLQSGASTAELYASRYYIQHFASQTQNKLGGCSAYTDVQSASAVTEVVGFQSLAKADSGSTITGRYHFKIEQGTGTGTVTNEYGFYNGDGFLKGTNKWFLYNDDATVDSYLKGDVTLEGKIIQSTGLAATKTLVNTAVQASHTGDILETTKYTLTIPAGIMGANSSLRIDFMTSCTNNANAKTVRAKLGGTTFATLNMTSQASNRRVIKISNRNSTNSQISFPASNTIGLGSSTVAVLTTAIDFTSSQTFTITVENANAGDTISVEDVTVEVINPGI